MMGGGSPQTFSRGGNPAPYVPMAQPQADQSFQNIVQQMIGSLGPNFSNTPAGFAYPGAQAIFQNLQNPLNAGSVGTTAANEAMQGAANAAWMGATGAPLLQQAGQQVLQTGFDPQQELFKRQQQQLLDQSNVANSMAGLGSSPYGASATANALGNFDLNWQNNLLNRMMQAGQSGTALLNAAPTLAATSTALPFASASGIGQGAQSALGNLTQLGNNQFVLPQQILNDLQSYLGLGQAASQLGLQGGNLGFNQTAQGIGGLLSGANTLFGNNGLLSGGSGLFGGGAGAGLGGNFLGASGDLIAPGTGAGAGIFTDLSTGVTSDLVPSIATPAASAGGLGSLLPFGLSGP